MRRALVLGTTAATIAALSLISPASAHQHGERDTGFASQTPQVVVTGLNNPRQLAVGKNASLLVAQAGRGGPDCVGEGEDAFCLGDTSSITRIRKPWSATPALTGVVGGLPSAAGGDGSFAVGTNGVGSSRSGRVVYGVNSASEGPAPADSVAGKLFKVVDGTTTIVADLAAYELANDPDGQGPDSNAYSVLVQKHQILVADAAANAVLAVTKGGSISTFHVFPNITTGPCADAPPEAPGRKPGCDFVPTALAAGPRGTVFVTGLAAEVPGEGRVVQLSRKGAVLNEWSGFTTAVGVAVRSNGTFYVSELFANADFENPNPPAIGQVTRVSGGVRTSTVVPLPAGLAIIGNRLYVAAYSVAPADGLFGNPDWNGQIWRLHL